MKEHSMKDGLVKSKKTQQEEWFRVVTYNVHKCRGLDRRIHPERIVEVLREVDADIIALQEVLSIEGISRKDHQARFIAEELGLDYRIGENRRLNGGAYGNVTLSRFPLLFSHNYDLSHPGHEERGCLRVDIQINKKCLVHVYNVHLGTSSKERRHQTIKIVHSEILRNDTLRGERLLLGDFNDWTQSSALQILPNHFDGEDIRHHLRRSRTYPGLFPFLHLDHIYFDRTLKPDRVRLHRSRKALIASDHLPIVADFRWHNLKNR